MKKIITLTLSLFMLITFVACGNEKNNNSQSNTQPSTSQQEKTTEASNYTEPTSLPRTPATELGFYHLDEMGYGIFGITGYSLSDRENPYVIFQSDYGPAITEFENGFVIYHEIDPQSYTINYKGKTYRYEIVNNDIFNVPGDGTCTIEERKTVSDYPNFVVFVSGSRWYVPYSLIDWERGVEDYEDPDDDYDYKYSFKLYLKDIK